MDELTCENCFWYEHRYEIHGYCRNPRNATVGSAGSDYSSSDLLKPMSAKINMVCDLHEAAGASSNPRNAYEIEPVPRDWRETVKAPYRTEWRRKALPSP